MQNKWRPKTTLLICISKNYTAYNDRSIDVWYSYLPAFGPCLWPMYVNLVMSHTIANGIRTSLGQSQVGRASIFSDQMNELVGIQESIEGCTFCAKRHKSCNLFYTYQKSGWWFPFEKYEWNWKFPTIENKTLKHVSNHQPVIYIGG